MGKPAPLLIYKRWTTFIFAHVYIYFRKLPLWNIAHLYMYAIMLLRRDAEAGMRRARNEPAPLPWDRESPFTRHLYHDLSPNGAPRLHRIDLWHSVHLGIGKTFAASSLMIFATALPGHNVDERFDGMSVLYANFCKLKHLDRLVQKLDINMCGGGGSSEATGTWNKAALTSNLCLFIEHLCDKYPDAVSTDERVQWIDSKFIKVSDWSIFSCIPVFLAAPLYNNPVLYPKYPICSMHASISYEHCMWLRRKGAAISTLL